MAFISLIFVYLVIILVIVAVTTLIGTILLIVSAVMKKRQLTKKKNAEMSGDYNYKVKKGYVILRILGIIFMIPLILCLAVIIYIFIIPSDDTKTSLSYNVLHLNTAQVEELIDSGVSPDCTEESNDAAVNGEKTLLYLLTEGILYDQWELEQESKEYIHNESLNMMKLLIEKGANVNYVTYYHDTNYEEHGYVEESYIYRRTDECGWTPLMEATARGDFDMIKLLVDNGADIHVKDYCGYNVINIVADYLEDEKGREILNYYLERGVDPENITKFGQSAWWLAMRNRTRTDPFKNDEIVAVLEPFHHDAEATRDAFIGWLIDYEETIQFSQLITVGDLDIDIYRQDELMYFYHPNQENYVKDGGEFIIERSGYLGDQDIVMGFFLDTYAYTMVLTSNIDQTVQIGIKGEGEDTVQVAESLSGLDLKAGDVVKIEYTKENSKVYLNDKEIDFEIAGVVR